MGSLMCHAAVVQVLGYRKKLDLVFEGIPLYYILFINNFRQLYQLTGEPAVELDLLIQSCMG